MASNEASPSDASTLDHEALLWLSSINLSRPIKQQSLAKDFSDGVLLAEVIAHFLPRFVNLSAFAHVSSVALKRYNWETLQKLVLRHLDVQLRQEEILMLANGDPTTIGPVILKVKEAIEMTIREGQYRPGARRSRRCRSATPSREGSVVRLHLLGLAQQQSSAEGSPHSSSIKSEMRGEMTLSREINNEQTIKRLCQRIDQLETKLQKKEERIHTLSKQVTKLLEIICRDQGRDERLSGSGSGTELGSPGNGWR